MNAETFTAIWKIISVGLETMNRDQIETIIFRLEAELMDRNIENLEEF